MVKAPGRVTDIPVTRVRNHHGLMPKLEYDMQMSLWTRYVDRVFDASNSSYCTMSTNKDIL